MIMRKADIEDLGISIGGRNITDLRYADDTALLANDITSMEEILDRVNNEGKKAGLLLNAKKTKVMHVNKRLDIPNVKVDNISLDYVTHFKYLGSIKESDGSCLRDVKARIGMAKKENTTANKYMEKQRHSKYTEGKTKKLLYGQ